MLSTLKNWWVSLITSRKDPSAQRQLSFFVSSAMCMQYREPWQKFRNLNFQMWTLQNLKKKQTYPKDFVFLFYRMLLCTSYRWLDSLKCWKNKENCYLPLLCFIAISLRLSKVNNPILYSRNTCRHCMGREFCGFVVFIAIIIFVTVYFHLSHFNVIVITIFSKAGIIKLSYPHLNRPPRSLNWSWVGFSARILVLWAVP